MLGQHVDMDHAHLGLVSPSLGLRLGSLTTVSFKSLFSYNMHALKKFQAVTSSFSSPRLTLERRIMKAADWCLEKLYKAVET